jgi:hypothetical protein
MIKKLIALAATALFSLNASAGYVQYDFSYGSPNNGLTGYVIQHDTDQSLAAFSLWLNDPNKDFGGQLQPFFGEGAISLTSASTYFRNHGPTSFTVYDNYGEDHITEYTVDITRGIKGNFQYTASYTANLYVSERWVSGTVSGIVIKGTVDPNMVTYLDQYGGYEPGVRPIVPELIKRNEVPEPASLALLAFGAVGLAGARQRKL